MCCIVMAEVEYLHHLFAHKKHAYPGRCVALRWCCPTATYTPK